jgi:hypothetical protein
VTSFSSDQIFLFFLAEEPQEEATRPQKKILLDSVRVQQTTEQSKCQVGQRTHHDHEITSKARCQEVGRWSVSKQAEQDQSPTNRE